MADDGTRQSKGGRARAQALDPDRRKEIGKQAALARWKQKTPDPDRMPEASHQGTLTLGDMELNVYVLEDNRRVFHKRGMARALGLKSDGGNAFLKTLSGKALGSSVPEALWEKIDNPVIFKPLNGEPAHGYEGPVLIEVCDAIVQARNDGLLNASQRDLARQAEMIIRSAAKVGITALIDEATGFIADKRRDEYRQLFQEFLREECSQWIQEFPDRFFDALYKLYGLKRADPKSSRHPGFFGGFIRKYVYWPLAGSKGAILEELDKVNPVVYVGGGRRFKLFQFLSDEVGMNAFRSHLWQVVGLMSGSADKVAFERAFYRAFPEARPVKVGETKDMFEGFENLGPNA